jgi:hypothetical protein
MSTTKGHSQGPVHRSYWGKRRIYRTGKPGLIARSLDRIEQVRLEEVEPADRVPILRRYLAVVPGARPYMPVDHHAPLAEFKRIAAQFPVFRITPAASVP